MANEPLTRLLSTTKHPAKIWPPCPVCLFSPCPHDDILVRLRDWDPATVPVNETRQIRAPNDLKEMLIADAMAQCPVCETGAPGCPVCGQIWFDWQHGLGWVPHRVRKAILDYVALLPKGIPRETVNLYIVRNLKEITAAIHRQDTQDALTRHLGQELAAALKAHPMGVYTDAAAEYRTKVLPGDHKDCYHIYTQRKDDPHAKNHRVVQNASWDETLAFNDRYVSQRTTAYWYPLPSLVNKTA